MKQNYIEWLFPGSFTSDSQAVKVPEYGFVPEIPERAFGYRHFSRTELELGGEKLFGSPTEYSGWTYFGKILTLDEVKALDGDYRILISNMEGNGWNAVVKTIYGQFMPLRDGDKVVS